MAGQSTGGGGLGETTITQIIAPGILIGASVYADDDLEQPYETWCSIHITRGGVLRRNRAFLITEGYISEESPLSWTGLFMIEPDDNILIVLRGNIDPVFRTKFQRMTPGNVQEIGAIIAAINRPA